MEPFKHTPVQMTVCKLVSRVMFQSDETFATGVDWYAVYEEMRAQTVQGLVMDILQELPIPEELKKIGEVSAFK